MVTATATHTLEDLALVVNRLIEEHPERVNPTGVGSSACIYHDEETDERCLIGEALFVLTGRNVPSEFEGKGVGSLLDNDAFCNYFGLPTDTEFVNDSTWGKLLRAQMEADRMITWGEIEPIVISDD